MNVNISPENFTSPKVHPSTNLTTHEDLLKSFRTGLLCFNVVIGVTHSYILWIIARGRRIPSEFINFNLTVCDLIFSLIHLLYLFENGTYLAILQWFLQELAITGRPLFQCLICVERYLAVVHPVTFLKYKPLRYRVICCTAVWIIALVSSSVIMIIICLLNVKAYIWFVSVQFLLFLSVQLFCLVAVLRALKQSGPGERGKKRDEENNMKSRVFYLILINVVTFTVMLAPSVFTGFLTILEDKDLKDASLFWFFSHCCFILAGFVQPVLYLHQAGKLFCLCS